MKTYDVRWHDNKKHVGRNLLVDSISRIDKGNPLYHGFSLKKPKFTTFFRYIEFGEFCFYFASI